MALNFRDLAFNQPTALFDFTRELMDGFIVQTESSIKSNIESFKADGTEEFEIEISAEEGIYQYVETYMGLDCFTVDLEDVFTSHFPSLQRRSALLTLVATYEHEFERFCLVIAEKHNKLKQFERLKKDGKKGFELYQEFLKRGMNIKGCTKYAPIKRLVKLRNSFAHNDARFVSASGGDIREILELLRQTTGLFATYGKQVVMLEGALEYAHDCFKDYIKELAQRIGELRENEEEQPQG